MFMVLVGILRAQNLSSNPCAERAIGKFYLVPGRLLIVLEISQGKPLSGTYSMFRFPSNYFLD